jgi:hypothetical protein
MPVALDDENVAGQAFMIEYLPFTVLIDREGIIQAIHVIVTDDEDKIIEQELKKMLAGQSLVEPKEKK